MMKKVLALLLALCLVFSLAACGKKTPEEPVDPPVIEDTIPDDTGDTDIDIPTVPEDDEDETPVDSDSEIVSAEKIFAKDTDAYKAIKDAQGKIQYIASAANGPVIITDKHWYELNVMGQISEFATLPDGAELLTYFNNTTIGENIVYIKDGAISGMDDTGTIRFNGIPFNKETDMLLYNDSLSTPWIRVVTKTADGYTTTCWAPKTDEHSSPLMKEDGTYEYEIDYSAPIGHVITNDKGFSDDWVEGYEIFDSVKEIFTLENTNNGFELVVRTNDNGIYYIDNIREGDEDWDTDTLLNTEVELKTHDPLLKNVDKIFNIGLIVTSPLHSKIDNDTLLYTSGTGESLMDQTDDAEVTITMPDGLTTKNIVSVFAVANAIGIVFDNNDVYLTKTLSDDLFGLDASGNYEMFKHDALSQAMKDNKIVSFGSNLISITDAYVYLLTDDGHLLACDVEDFVE